MAVFAVMAIPFLFGLAVGRWWVLLMLALPATTMFAQGSHAGMPAGPTAAVTLLPVAGAACGVALRAAVSRGLQRDSAHRGEASSRSV
jgi:hypothetical protein